MKRSIILFSLIVLFTLMGFGQDEQGTLPEVYIKTLDGKTINASSFDNGGKPILIIFWATWSAPSKNRLNIIAEEYEDWVKETGVKLIVISIDDQRTSPKVRPYVDSRAWEYEVYVDENQDFKRALSVVSVPHCFILNADKKIVWELSTYNEGDEEKIIAELRNIAK